MNRRRFLSIAAAATTLGPAGLSAASEGAPEVRWSGVALGARASITLRGPGGETALAHALAALETAEAEFSLYRPDSALARLNGEGRLRPSPTFRRLMAICRRLHRDAEGLFDPTVQSLWRALATGGDSRLAAETVGFERIAFGDDIVLAPGQQLTLNGVAQGFATDLAAEALMEAGFANALTNIGEFRALAGDWRIGVAASDGRLLDVVDLSGGAVATSSPGAMTVGGRSHILAPDGRPPIWSTVSVRAPSAAIADGLSTALSLARRSEIDAIGERFENTRISTWL
ncbi:MAG: FAD:protein FMN transferase [Pseudomonadota bacterium]